MNEPDKAMLKSVAWFAHHQTVHGSGSAAGYITLVCGATSGSLLFRSNHAIAAAIVWITAGAVGSTWIVSKRARAAIAERANRFGRWLGLVTGAVLLSAAYVLVFTPLRVLRRVAKVDDLSLRQADDVTFWSRCDAEHRTRRYARAMFATEVLRERPRSRTAGLIMAAFLLLLAEAILQLAGIGDAVLYQPDPRAGYMPAPNQRVGRAGGRVIINRVGMRAPDFATEKPEDTFRIMMLGDSTLYGGSYIDQEGLYARIVARDLNERFRSRTIEVLNIGVIGWGPFHQRGYVEKFGTFDADLIVLCIPYEDVDRDHYTLMNLPYFNPDQPPRLALEVAAMHLMWRYRAGHMILSPEWHREQRAFGIREYERLMLFLRDGDKAGEAAKPLYGDAFASGVRVNGAEVFLEILPSISAGLQDEMTADEADVVGKLRAVTTKHGIRMHYPAGLFRGHGEPDELYHDKGHLHWKGHQLYAKYLEERIVQESTAFDAWVRARPSEGSAP